ncbi:MAG: dihydropteridine reductase [Clostridia bacterium]|nr:dihydropteridine reductase [Clostridia bacterium]
MSNNEQQVVERISAQYTKKEPTELDKLRQLDARVKRPANVFSYILGGISALIMGSGMSLVMTDIAGSLGMNGDSMSIGIIIGIIGMLMAIINYPLHKLILNERKKKYASEILKLSESIIGKS